MPRTDFITDEAQLEAFRQAVAELGGQRETARLLGVHERTVRDLVSPEGRRQLHAGFLRDISAQLLAKIERCRALERRLSPAFTANLTPEQSAGPTGRQLRAERERAERRTVKVIDPAVLCQACGRTHAQGHAAGCSNAAEPWPTIEATEA